MRGKNNEKIQSKVGVAPIFKMYKRIKYYSGCD